MRLNARSFARAACAIALAAICAGQPAQAAERRLPHGEVRLVDGLGAHHHPVSTRVGLAQRFFDQGLAWVYAFNHQEAIRSFRRAAMLDPDLAMAHWGVALALGPNYNAPLVDEHAAEARAELEVAGGIAARNPATTAVEREYIAALALRFPDAADAKTIVPADAYRDAMRDLARRHPEDPDAATLFADAAMTPRAWRLWDRDGMPASGTDEIVATLERVLADDPDHLGANHLYIHAIEGSPHPERGVASADRLLVLAPAAGHLLHMPAHIYDRIGNHAASARANRLAIAADRAYFRDLRGANPYRGYFTHNLHFLAIAYANDGRYRDAIAAAREFARTVAAGVPEVARLGEYLPAEALIDVRFERWNAILALPRPPERYGGLHAVWRFARGMAYAGKRRLGAAESERGRLAATLATVPADEMWGRNAASDVFAIATALLDGYIAALRGDPDAAIGHWRGAAKADDALAYDEPAPWYLPPREPLARALIARGERDEARRVIDEELRRRPGSRRALELRAAIDGSALATQSFP